MKTITLQGGVRIPLVGMGMWKVPDEQAAQTVVSGLELGYRLIDTAAIYRNERGTGAGIRGAAIPREELVVATKAWNENLRQGTVRRGFEDSLTALGLDYVDLYLMHWPVPGKYADCWTELCKLRREGLAKAVGVCNCTVRHLEELAQATGETPALLQVERHPFLSQMELLDYCREHGIALQAYSPLMQGGLDQPVLLRLAEQYGRTPAQVVLRWHTQREVAVIPKSVTPRRQAENLDVFGFSLREEDMAAIDAMNRDQRFCADPDNFDF